MVYSNVFLHLQHLPKIIKLIINIFTHLGPKSEKVQFMKYVSFSIFAQSGCIILIHKTKIVLVHINLTYCWTFIKEGTRLKLRLLLHTYMYIWNRKLPRCKPSKWPNLLCWLGRRTHKMLVKCYFLTGKWDKLKAWDVSTSKNLQ